MKKIAIIGYGRFGELLARLAKDSFDVAVIETNEQRQEQARSHGLTVIPLALLPRANFIFLAVPISALDDTLQTIAPLVSKEQVVIDLCSVKSYPAQLLQKHVGHCQLLASHPMFGPDSAKKGLEGLQVALCPLSINETNLKIIKDFWRRLGCEVVRTTPDEHDRDNAYSLAFTHSIAKIIINTGIPDITFQTRSFKDITEVAALSSKDTDQLFHDILFYNPYFPEMKAKLISSINQTIVSLESIEQEQAKAMLF